MPANAGDMGSIPDPGRSHMHGATKSLCHNHWAGSHDYWGHMPQLPRPEHLTAHALQQEKPQPWEACAPQLESSLHSRQLDKSLCSNKDPAQPKKKKKNKTHSQKTKQNKTKQNKTHYLFPYLEISSGQRINELSLTLYQRQVCSQSYDLPH